MLDSDKPQEVEPEHSISRLALCLARHTVGTPGTSATFIIIKKRWRAWGRITGCKFLWKCVYLLNFNQK